MVQPEKERSAWPFCKAAGMVLKTLSWISRVICLPMTMERFSTTRLAMSMSKPSIFPVLALNCSKGMNDASLHMTSLPLVLTRSQVDWLCFGWEEITMAPTKMMTTMMAPIPSQRFRFYFLILGALAGALVPEESVIFPTETHHPI